LGHSEIAKNKEEIRMRGRFLAVLVVLGIVAVACAAPTPMVVEKEVPVTVVKEVPVEVEKEVVVEVEKEVPVEVVVTATPEPERGGKSAEENKTIVHRAEELWNTGNLDIADEVYATDFVNHDPSAPDVRDLETYKGFIAATRTGFPDFHVTMEDMIAEGDKVASRWTARGTHQGELIGIPPTGKQATWTGMTIYRFAGGKIVEAWWSKDMLSLLIQLGVVPPPGQGGQ
jgi:steroid delta-isomerase-like uncharacterized protein